MISAVRRSRLASSLAALGLCAVLTVTVSSPLHDGLDDPLCNPTGHSGDHQTDQLAGVSHAAAQAEHCLVCHAVQSLRAEPPSSRFGPRLAIGKLVVSGQPPAIHALLGPSAPARAPPVA